MRSQLLQMPNVPLHHTQRLHLCCSSSFCAVQRRPCRRRRPLRRRRRRRCLQQLPGSRRRRRHAPAATPSSAAACCEARLLHHHHGRCCCRHRHQQQWAPAVRAQPRGPPPPGQGWRPPPRPACRQPGGPAPCRACDALHRAGVAAKCVLMLRAPARDCCRSGVGARRLCGAASACAAPLPPSRDDVRCRCRNASSAAVSIETCTAQLVECMPVAIQKASNSRCAPALASARPRPRRRS